MDIDKIRRHEEYIRSLHEHPRISFFDRTRYVVLAISIISLSWLMGNSLILNFTIICMSKDNSNCTDCTDVGEGKMYYYSNSQKGLLFAAVAIGSIVGTYPVVFLETLLSIRSLLTLFGFISGISTLLSPLFASLGFWFLFAMRFFQGFALAVNYPVLGNIVNNWSSLRFSGMYTAWLSCNLQFGAMVTMPVAGEFCVSSGWEGAFYLQGGLTIVCFIIFYLFFRDTPRIHGFVSAKELKLIEQGKTAICEKKVQPVPYGPIFKSIAIWGVWICCIGATFGYQIFVQYGPTYLNKALNYEITNIGFLTAIANFASCIVKILGGPLSDVATAIPLKIRVKLFTIISQGVMALSFVLLALVPSSLVILAQIAYIAAVAFSGMMWVGAVKSASLVARQHAHFVFAVLSFINSAVILILPPFVTLLAPDNTRQQWSLVLFVICGLVIISTAFYAIVGEAEPAWWTDPEKVKSRRNQIFTLSTTDVVQQSNGH